MESYKGAVHSAKDAIILLEASRINMIPRITRRLKEQERSQIKAGDVFIWNEKEAKMRRWTDGRSWSASRVTGSFLTYREMETSSDSKNTESSLHHSNYTYKTNGLIKQSFSLTTLKGDKMHLISYTTTGSYTNSKFSNKTPSTDPFFANVKIPKEIYPDLNDSYNSGSEKSPKLGRSSSVVSILSISATPATSNSPLVETNVSPLPSPVSISGASVPLRLSSPIIKVNSTPRNILQQAPVQAQTSNNLPRLPPLRDHSIQPVQTGRLNSFNNNNVCYDSVALNALDRLSFRF